MEQNPNHFTNPSFGNSKLAYKTLWMLIKLPTEYPYSHIYPHTTFLTTLSNKPMKKNKNIKPIKTIQKTSTKNLSCTSVTSESSTQKVKPRTKQKVNDKTVHQSGTSSLSQFLKKWPILPPQFYHVDALQLAPQLLGKYLRKDDVVLQITEVEAYRPNDSACHGRFGVTARTAPVFGPGGHAYVYLCYGLHMMLNVVADEEGVGAAVLVRACAPVRGLETIQQRRGLQTDKPILLTGPGKVGQALGLSTDWSNHPLFSPGGLEVLDGPKPEKILVGPRVGINYALPEHVNALWRFAIADTPWISAPKNTLQPA